jgi:hypothetical protein
MGTWGHGSFANDSALDWLGELREGDASLVRAALEAVADADEDAYLEFDECAAALAAAELVAASLGKGHDRLDKDAASWLPAHVATVQAVGAQLAHRAVERVFGQSELRELWDENGPDTEWHTDVRKLLILLAA